MGRAVSTVSNPLCQQRDNLIGASFGRQIFLRQHSIVRLRNRTTASSQSTNDDCRPNTPSEHVLSVPHIAIIAALASSIVAATPPAQAAEWHPRRHMRRMKDTVFEDGSRPHRVHTREHTMQQKTQSTDGPHGQQATSSSLLSQVRTSLKRAYRELKRTSKEEAVYSVGISGRSDPLGHYSAEGTGVPLASPLGWWAIGIALVGVVYAIWGRHLPFLGGFKKRRTEGGRWIRDRSLGGKLVFVPDGVASSTIGSSGARLLWDDALDEEIRSTTLTSTSTGTNTKETSTGPVTPEWWAPPAGVKYVPASRKEELARESRAILRELEDGKLLRGQDYPLFGLVKLRQVCSEGGGLQVKPRTENGRDAMLRAGVKYALELSYSVENPASNLGGYEPGRFISGLATDLGMPEKRAVTITHAEVAAACRSAIIDAEAGYRAQDNAGVFRALGRLVAMLKALPLPPGSPEAELVGRSIQAQTTLEFRRSVFLTAGSVDMAVAPVIAEMLGFDPSLVMPKLLTQMAAVKASRQQSMMPPPASIEDLPSDQKPT